MIARFFSRTGRRETLWAATIISVPTIVVLCVLNQPINDFGYSVFVLLFICYCISAVFVGDRIVNDVLRHGDRLFGNAVAWAISSQLLGVAVTALITSFFTLSSTDGYWELLGMMLWYGELLIGLVALLPMIVASIYYWKQLQKIKDAAMTASLPADLE